MTNYYLMPRFTSSIAEFAKMKSSFELFDYNPKRYTIYQNKDFTVNLCQLSFMEFRIIEKSQFINDLISIYTGNRNPFYIVINFTNSSKDDFYSNAPEKKKISDKLVSIFMYCIYISNPYVSIPNPLEYIIYSVYNSLDENSFDIKRYINTKGREVYEYILSEHISINDLKNIIIPLFHEFVINWNSYPYKFEKCLDLFSIYHDMKHSKTSVLYLICIIELLCKPSLFILLKEPFKETKLADFFSNYKKYRNKLVHSGLDNEKFRDDIETFAIITIIASLLIKNGKPPALPGDPNSLTFTGI